MPTRLNRDGRKRDTQKQRVYDAENTALESVPATRTGERLLYGGKKVLSTGSVSIEACQEYVDWLCQQAWFQRRWGRQRLTVRHKVYGSARGGYGRVTLPPWARKEWVILHEVAHGLLPKPHAWHGPEFVGIYLTLVRFVLGEEAGRQFLDALRKEKVRRSLAAVPGADTHVPVTATVRDARTKAARNRPVTRDEAAKAADVLRRAAKQGLVGNAGTKPREGALAAARALEAHATAAVPVAAQPAATTRRVTVRTRQRAWDPVLSASEAQALVERQPSPPVGLTELLRLHALDARG